MPVPPLYGFIYLVEAVGADRIKIGWTAASPRRRLAELQVCSPFPLDLIGAMRGSRLDERRLHRTFEADRIIGEWFAATPTLREIARASFRLRDEVG